MHFVKSLVLGLSALAATVAAQSKSLYFTSQPSNVMAGSATVVKYMYTGHMSDPVTILLRKGPSTDLKTIQTLTTSATGGEYTFTPSSSLASGTDYALEILANGESNYSGQFTISGGSGSYGTTTSKVPYYPHTVSQVSSYATMTTAPVYNTSTMLTTYPGGTISGSSIPIARNTTFLSATLSPTIYSTPVVTLGATTVGGSGSLPSPTSNSASGLNSQLALVFGAVAAVLYLH